MARIDYAVSMTAIQSGTLEGKTIEAIEDAIGKTLSGGKSNTTWNGAAPTLAYKQSRTSANTIVVDSGADGLWIKHSGKKYDSGLSTTVEETTKVTVSGGSDFHPNKRVPSFKVSSIVIISPFLFYL